MPARKGADPDAMKKPPKERGAGAARKPVYSRIVVKLSGESLSGPDDFGIHAETIRNIAREVKEVQELGVEVALIVGGGNIFRGARQQGLEIDRATWARYGENSPQTPLAAPT